jgi:hypothetical protein
MGLRSLSDRDGTATVSLDKSDLELDGVLDDGEVPSGKRVHYQRLAPGVYVIRDVRDGEVAPLPAGVASE